MVRGGGGRGPEVVMPFFDDANGSEQRRGSGRQIGSAMHLMIFLCYSVGRNISFPDRDQSRDQGPGTRNQGPGTKAGTRGQGPKQGPRARDQSRDQGPGTKAGTRDQGTPRGAPGKILDQ